MPACQNSSRRRLPGKLTDDDVYLMMMLHRYQRKSCEQLARKFGISRAQVYDLLARRQVGGCCG
jgi:transposase